MNAKIPLAIAAHIAGTHTVTTVEPPSALTRAVEKLAESTVHSREEIMGRVETAIDIQQAECT